MSGRHTRFGRAIGPAALAAALVVAFATPGLAAPASPVVTGPEDGSIHATSIVELVGTVDGETTSVQVKEGATSISTGGVAGGAFRIGVPLADGFHTLQIYAHDAAGIASAPTGLDLVVDTIAPAIPSITAPIAGAVLAHAPIVVDGTAEAFARVRVSDQPLGVSKTTVAAGSGRWQVTMDLGDAQHEIRAVAIDAAGNQSGPSPSVAFTIDTVAPVAPTVSLPREGQLTNQTTIVVSGFAEPASTVRIEEGGPLASVTAGGDATWRTTLTFTPGSHALTVRAIDAAGHPSEPTIRRFEIDTTPPEPPVMITPVEDSINAASTLVSGTAEAGTVLFVTRGPTVVATTTVANDGIWSIRIDSPSGLNQLRARARDLAGNTSAYSVTRSFFVDTELPVVDILTPDGAVFLPGQTVKIQGTATDDYGVESVSLDFYDLTGRGVSSHRAICDRCPTGKQVEWRSAETPLIGRFVVRVYATDRVGNRSVEQSVIVTIVRTP